MKESSGKVVYYSQNKEDLILSGFFKDVEKGFYVDVGANHPIHDSVTNFFYVRGWSGINIEPNAALMKSLNAERPKDINLHVGVSDKSGTLKLREYQNHGLSTFSPSIQKGYNDLPSKETKNYRDYDVRVITLREVFDKQKLPHIHFLKIDVEGLEYEVLKGNDWKKYRPEVICIEANHITKDWRPFIIKQNYFLAFNDGLNDYYVAKESENRAKAFSYPDSVLLGPPKIPYYLNDQLERQYLELNSAHEALDRQSQHIKYLETELITVRDRNEQLTQIVNSSLPNRLKRFLKAVDFKVTELSNRVNNRPLVGFALKPLFGVYRMLRRRVHRAKSHLGGQGPITKSGAMKGKK